MAAVDQRLGVVRRGVTPAAPKPINLPSQKFENHRLIPDVEIVPRGTCCWGNAVRSIPESEKSNEKTDSVCLPSGNNGTEDHGNKEQNVSGLINEAQSPVEKSDLVCTVESSPLLDSSPECAPVAESCNGNRFAKAGSDSIADSDAGSLPESVARPSSSESYSSSSVTATTRVEEEKDSSGFSQVYVSDYEKVSNFQVKQETHVGIESPRGGSQDFGYYEGFYSTQAPFPRPGVPYPNGMGMAFGPGMHPEPSHHYSFLGVPYYDSVKDKEIVVITMVGSPGVCGNYLPYPGFPDQYGRPSVYENFPLQFGHFENFAGPQVPAEMNQMCSGENSGYVCHEQDTYKHGWVNGRSTGTERRDNGSYFPTSHSLHELNPASDDCRMPKRMGRQKAMNRNRRAAFREASPTVFVPERRVTLLTKVSQHEVIISDMHRKSKHEGVRHAKSTFSPHVVAEDVTEVPSAPQPAQNSIEISVCAPRPTEAILPMQGTNHDGVLSHSGTSHSTLGQAAMESTETTIVGEDVEESCTPDMSDNLSARESFSLQAVWKGSDREDSSLEPRCDEDAKTTVLEPSETAIITPLPASAPGMTSQTQHELAAQDQGSIDACSPTVLCQMPVSSMETFSVSADNIRIEPEVTCVTKVGEIHLDSSSDSSFGSVVCMELACKQMNDNGALSASTAGSLSNKCIGKLIQKQAIQKCHKKWRRKGSVDFIKPGDGGSDHKVEDSAVDNSPCSHNLRNDISRHAMHAIGMASLASSPQKVKPLSEGSVSLSSCAPAVSDDFAASIKNGLTTVSLVDPESDKLCMNERCKMGGKAGFSTTGSSECVPGFCATRVSDSSTKISSTDGGQMSLLRIVSCGVGKKWRPKLSGAGRHDTSVTKVSGAQIDKVAAAPAVSGLQVMKNESVSDHTGSREVSCEDYDEDNCKKELRPCKDYRGEKSCQKPSHNVEASEFVQGDAENKLSQTVLKQHRSEDLSLNFERSGNAEDYELNSRKNSLPKNSILGKHCHTWRVIEKQQKAPLVSKPEEVEHSNSVVKRKETMNFVHQASQQSWRPKQSCPFNKGVRDNPSNAALQNIVPAEGGNRQPFSMKNFSNDDNMKAIQIQKSLPNSSIHIQHGIVRENMYAARIGHGKSQSSSRTYMKLGRGGESHITKKVEKKGWVVKTETAHLKA